MIPSRYYQWIGLGCSAIGPGFVAPLINVAVCDREPCDREPSMMTLTVMEGGETGRALMRLLETSETAIWAIDFLVGRARFPAVVVAITRQERCQLSDVKLALMGAVEHDPNASGAFGVAEVGGDSDEPLFAMRND